MLVCGPSQIYTKMETSLGAALEILLIEKENPSPFSIASSIFKGWDQTKV